MKSLLLRDKNPSVRLVFWLFYFICIIAPLLGGTFLIGRRQQRESRLNYEEEFDLRSQGLISALSESLCDVERTVTIIEESRSIRTNMKKYVRSHSMDEIIEISDVIDAPLSFKQAFTNENINTVTIFANEQLAYYDMNFSAIDLALQRCDRINITKMDIDCQTGRFVSSLDGSPYVYWVKDYRNIYENHVYGRIIVEVNPLAFGYEYQLREQIQSGRLNAKPDSGLSYYLYNQEGAIIFSSNSDAVGKPLSNFWTEEAERKYILTTFEMKKYQLNGIIYQPAAAERPPLEWDSFVYVICYLAALLILGLILIQPFTKLLTYTRFLQKGISIFPGLAIPYAEAVEPMRALEESYLRLQTLQKERDSSKSAIKEAQMQALQSQIDPHFFFNMLDIIGWKAQQSQTTDTSTMVNQLGEMLRSDIINNGKQELPLRQELKYVENYLSLQQIGGNVQFEYKLNVDTELLDSCNVPKLILQPIVENCIVHGFRHLGRTGMIQVDVWEDLNSLLFRIRDNGCGFDPDSIPDGPADLSAASRRNRVALANIRQRLKLLYGEAGSMQISSTIGAGTTVLITIPWDPKEQ